VLFLKYSFEQFVLEKTEKLLCFDLEFPASIQNSAGPKSTFEQFF
jgi:hypothetical protein